MHARLWSHFRATHERRSLSPLLVCVLVVGLAGIATVTRADKAEAATAGILQPGIAITGVTDWGSSWLGAMQAPAGYGDDIVFCITAGGDDPVGTTPVSEDTIADPVLASVMTAHRWDNDAITRAAISYMSHMRWETGTKTVSAQTRKARYEAHTPQNVKDRAYLLLQEATSVAGPYGGANTGASGAGARTGDVHNIGVVNGVGGWTSGLRFTATLSGPAVFDANHANSISGQTEASPITLAWTATGTGPVTFSVVYQDVPRQTITRLLGGGSTQTVITGGHRPAGADPRERTSPPITFEVVGQFQPVATTAVGSKTVAQGDALVDRVTVGTAPGDSWLTVGGTPVPVTFVGTAYATGLEPPAAPGSVPPDAVALGTTSLTVSAVGTYSASIPGVGTGEFVTWVWRMSVAEQPAVWQPYLRGSWQDAFGQPSETASVRHKASATSQVVVRSDEGGRPVGLADDVLVVGFPDDHPGFAGGAGFTADRTTITQSLWYFPEGLEVSDAHRGEATLLGQVEVPAANGAYASVGDGAFTLPRTSTGAGVPGTYVFTHRFDGDDRVEPFETSVTATTEQFALGARPLVLSTLAVPERAVVLGDRAVAHDVATVVGDIPDGATVAFELYQWPRGGEPECTTPVWASPGLMLTGEGDVVSPPADVTAVAGDLGFVAVVRGGDGTVLARGECGAADETLPTGAYEVATSAVSDRSAVFGDEVVVRDTATVTGQVPTDGTLTFELYTWPTGTEPVCEQPVWTSDAVPLVVGETASPEVLVDPVRGDLGFVAVTRGADGRELSRGTCGAPEETVVDDELAVGTVAHANGAVVLGRSADVWDVATVTGHPAEGTTLTFELYTWRATDAPSCVDPLWQSQPIALTGPGDVTSAVTTVPLVTGSLGFVQVTRGADGRVLARGECGEAVETLTAVPELAETGSGDGAWRLAVLAAGLLVVGAGALLLGRRRVD